MQQVRYSLSLSRQAFRRFNNNNNLNMKSAFNSDISHIYDIKTIE